MTAGRGEFERAIAAYRLDDLPIPEAVLDACEQSLRATGLVLVGEVHGVEQTPRAVLALARRLDVDALAFESSWDQFDHVVQPVLAGGRVDRDALWTLPPDAEALCGDGRFTAGHVAVLEAFADGLQRLVCVDRLESPSPQKREEAMAERLVRGRRPGGRMLAVVGTWHAGREPADGAAPAAALVRAELPELVTVALAPGPGTTWFQGERTFEPRETGLDVELPIGPARPAVVPRR